MTKNMRRMSQLIMCCAGAAVLCGALGSRAGALGAEDRVAAGGALGTEESIRSVDDLLYALERADSDIRTFSARIQYERRLKLQGDVQIREGNLHFAADDPGIVPAGAGAGEADVRRGRTFAVVFDTLITDDVKRVTDDRWIFDGRWLIEKDNEKKQYIKREIAPPESRLDPLRLGEGPLPIPIGQKRDEILARYKAELLEASDGLESGFVAQVADTFQLRLVPREPERAQSEFTEIRLWYRKGSLHPRLAHTIDRAGDESYVWLINARINDGAFDRSVIDLAEPDAGEGWDVQVIEGHFAEGSGGRGGATDSGRKGER